MMTLGTMDAAQRLRVVLWCIILVMIIAYWTQPPPASSSSTNSNSSGGQATRGGSTGNLEPVQIEPSSEDDARLQAALQTAAISMGDTEFPTNLTAIFRGSWSLMTQQPTPTPLPANLTAILQPLHESPGILGFQMISGDLAMRIVRSQATALDGVQVVQGKMQIADGKVSKQNDLQGDFAGVYLQKLGKLALISSPNGAHVGLTLSNAVGQSSVSRRLSQVANVPSTIFDTDLLSAPTESEDVMPWLLEKASAAVWSAGSSGNRALFDRPQCVTLFDLDVAPKDVTDDADDSESPRQQFLLLSGTIRSPNCSFAMNITMRAMAVNMEKVEDSVLQYCAMMTVVVGLQLVTVVHQLNFAGTPSVAGRISLITVGMQALLDAYSCLVHLSVAVLWEQFFNYFALVAFAELILFSILEMRLLMVIWAARQSDGAVDTAILRRQLILMYARFYFCLMLGIVLVVQFWGSLSWFVMIMYTFWIPQIIHYAYRGVKDGVSPLYVLIMASTRIVPPLYVWMCPVSLARLFVRFQLRPGLGYTMLGLMAAQIGVIFLQHRFGPQFFVPKFCLPAKYNYRRSIPRGRSASATAAPVPTAATRLEAVWQGMKALWARIRAGRAGTYERVRAGSGDTQDVELPAVTRTSSDAVGEMDVEGGVATGGASGAAGDGVDCVICMCEVEPTETDYMITPCDHLFHAACLERWMEVKMECPSCRAPLPPA